MNPRPNTGSFFPLGNDTGWEDARLMTACNNTVFILRGAELVGMNPLPNHEGRLVPIGNDTGWRHARLMAGYANRLFIIRDNELVAMNPAPVGSQFFPIASNPTAGTDA